MPVDLNGLIQSQMLTKYEGSLVREISSGDWNSLRSWVGQYRVKVNPKSNSFDVSFFDFGKKKSFVC